ncbi:hypothetical protein [Agromyces sp. Soil535]|uniref:hypothetical protein n=1 Tax=Agromyces sp. Soil535 TaxID=1736390 RepID=UPI000B24C57B|nr:hypothetical protein [Agromyces sp. Soil535]
MASRKGPAEGLPDVVAEQVAVVLRAYRTESAVYGVILVSTLIAIGWEAATDLEVLLFTLGAVVVFWLAHVFAGTIAREEVGETRWRSIITAARASVRHSWGMLLPMVLPAVFLGLSALNVIDEYVGYYLALWVGVAVLAVIGWVASARRGSHWGWNLFSAAATASLGLIVIWLSSLVH